MIPEYDATARTRPTRKAERVSHDRAAVHAVLDAGFHCHVGFVVDGRPVVLPQLYVRSGEVLYLHGSTGARALRSASPDGLDVCVTVTHVDGLVFARSAMHHSLNYRSVVVHGTAVPVTDEADKRAALAAVVEAVAPGRSAHTRPPTAKELAATAVLALPLVEVSLKARTGGPMDDEADLALGHWAGVLPLHLVAGEPVAALGIEDDAPAHVLNALDR
ncbi:MAG: pyridoxamine 5'-phosphate oxidase family protein [Mycobacteriales bacterium]|nr:pyridoxamine 5'-phosphate oxidase family protein [Mycobacteriales bacterium]